MSDEQVTIDRGEWNRLNAKIRKLEGENKRLKAEAAAPDPNEGDRLERELAERDVRDAVAAEARKRGFSEHQAAAVSRLVNTDGDQDAAARLDATLQLYPGAFTLPEPEPVEPEPTPRRRRQSGPSTPTESAFNPAQFAPPAGYITPGEYLATPRDKRLTPEFRERVAKSEKFWPDKVRADVFGSDK